MNTDLSKFAVGSHVEVVFTEGRQALLAAEWLKGLLNKVNVKIHWTQTTISFVLSKDFDHKAYNKIVKPHVRAIHSVVMHGAYYNVSRFCMVQHRYAATDCEASKQGFLEVLEILDVPEGHLPYLVHSMWVGSGARIYELHEMKQALEIYSVLCGDSHIDFQELAKGVKSVDCKHGLPWFYADCDDEIDGDIVRQRELP
ncbi:hypothetical protein KKG46_03150 [Patescibacteria group bacterium]|nr:hypothetical protein [Patescibacteria group bacterium]